MYVDCFSGEVKACLPMPGVPRDAFLLSFVFGRENNYRSWPGATLDGANLLYGVDPFDAVCGMHVYDDVYTHLSVVSFGFHKWRCPSFTPAQ